MSYDLWLEPPDADSCECGEDECHCEEDAAIAREDHLIARAEAEKEGYFDD